MNELIKVPFCENQITVIEKANHRYVAMKPIVEALGLNWTAQYELIQRDPVLSQKGIRITVPTNGGPQEMFCLQLDYLNGWLFKIPASRYTGKRREIIMRYQKECYNALFEYFHNGGAVNPNISAEQVQELVDKIEQKLDAGMKDLNSDTVKTDENPRLCSLKKYFENRAS